MPPVDDIVISPQTAIFYCEAFGTVPPNITWLMNGNTLASQGDIEIAIDTVESRRNSTLYVRNTVPNDAGNYTCMAESAAGIVSVSAELIVNGMLLLVYLLKFFKVNEKSCRLRMATYHPFIQSTTVLCDRFLISMLCVMVIHNSST